MEIVDWENEFEPLSSDKVDFLLDLVANVKGLSKDDGFGLENQSVLELAGHHMLVLLSMTLAGFDLYRSVSTLAAGLHDEASRFMEICKHLNVDESLLESLAVTNYEKYVNRNG